MQTSSKDEDEDFCGVGFEFRDPRSLIAPLHITGGAAVDVDGDNQSLLLGEGADMGEGEEGFHAPEVTLELEVLQQDMVVVPQVVVPLAVHVAITNADIKETLDYVQATHSLDHLTFKSLQRGLLNNAIVLLIDKANLKKTETYSWKIMGFTAHEWIQNCKDANDPIKWMQNIQQRDPRSEELAKYKNTTFNKNYFRR